jgi:hypothetical protein
MAETNKDLEEDLFERPTLMQRIKRSRFLAIAVLVHIVVLLIFGGKILWESRTKQALQSQALFAPPSKQEQKPAQETDKKVDVKVQPTKTPTKTVLANDKLSGEFNVPLPDVIPGPVAGDVASGTDGSGAGGSEGVGLSKVDVPKTSIQIVFCVDISRSMIRGGRAFKVVEIELQKQLRRLNETHEFNVITFAKVGHAYKDKLVGGSVAAIEEALLWFHKLSPDSFKAENWKKDQVNGILDFHLGSHPHIALQQAFEQKPDVVVLLSDGNPTDISRQEVVDLINSLQEKVQNKVVVHTVLFPTANTGEESERAKNFMETLALNTGGEFKMVNNPKKSGPGGGDVQ